MAQYIVANCPASAYDGTYIFAGYAHSDWYEDEFGNGYIWVEGGSYEYYTHQSDSNKIIYHYEVYDLWIVGRRNNLDDWQDWKNGSSGIYFPPSGLWDGFETEVTREGSEFSRSNSQQISLSQVANSFMLRNELSDSLSIGQLASVSKIANASASNSVTLDDDVIASKFYLAGTNSLTLNDEVGLQCTYGRNATDSLTMTDLAICKKIANLNISDNISLDDSNFKTWEEQVDDTVTVSQSNTRLRIITRAASQTVMLSDILALIDSAENGFSTTHTATAYANKPISHTITITDSASREPMAFGRAASSSFTMGHFASVYNNNAPSHGDCTEGDPCTRDHTTLYWGDYGINLRNPEEDALVIVQNLINRYTRGEELRNTCVHPRFLQLKYTFTKIPASQKSEFIAFYKLTAGFEINIIDYCGQEWVGCILDHDIDISREEGRLDLTDPLCPETDDGLYTFAFTFEGERVV